MTVLNPWQAAGLAGVLRLGANRGNVIYLDGQAGDDANDGRTIAQPVATFLHAISHCTDWLDDYIIVLDYWQTATEEWPIVVDKNMCHIIGLSGQGCVKVQVNPPGETAAFQITAESVEIANLSCNAGTTSAGVEWDGAAQWGGEVHHCWFGEMGTAQDGIRPAGPYAKIWACRFGEGLTRHGVHMPNNSTRGMIGVPGLEPNWFRGVGGIAINIANQFAQGGIFNNRIAMHADTAGGAITLAGTCVGVHVDGNSACWGETAVAHNNPYLDGAAVNVNLWGYNTWNEIVTVPG